MTTTTKILNLDELAKEERVLKLNGKSHKMKDTSVEEFITASKAAEEAEKAEGSDDDVLLSKMIENMVEMVMNAFPTIVKEDVSGLRLEQLNAIVDFAMGDSKEKIEKLAEEKEGELSEKKSVEAEKAK